MDDFVLNVKQVGQYPRVSAVQPSDAILMQQGGAGGAYANVGPLDLFISALAQQSTLKLAAGASIQWTNGATLTANSNGISLSGTMTAANFTATAAISTPALTIGGQTAATVPYVDSVADAVFAQSVHTFNGRNGDVLLSTEDVLRAGAAPIVGAHFGGHVTAPTPWNSRANDDTVATTAFVQGAICEQLNSGHVVLSYNGRGGHVIPLAADVTRACTVFGEWALTNTPPSGDVSNRIANTAFVDDTMFIFRQEIERDFAIIADQLDQKYAPLDSAQLVGIPTAPTAAQTINSGQIATTAFVHAAVTASTTGVSSFNTRTGAVVLEAGDVTGVGGALLNSPPLTGLPTCPTRNPGDNTAAIASTAFVAAAIAGVDAGVTSFNARTGAVVLTAADVQAVGGAPIASPNFTGSPTAPNPPPGDNDTSIATTAFVTQAISVLPAPVTSFNGRVGAVNFQASDISAVNGALLASPAFTGTPTGPTATAGTSNTQFATTAFVQNAVSSVVAGVASFNSRTGIVTFTAGDLTSVGGALLAGPTFTGVPAAPTATIGTNTTQLATTAFVQAALSAAPGGVSSFNGRTGSITFLAADVSAVGGALLSSPAFSGNPTAPTPAPGDSDTSIATTAFVATAIASSGGVNSFNGRAGAVVMNAADIIAASGVVFEQADTAPATGLNRFWFDSIKGQLYVNYRDPTTTFNSWVIANSMVTPPVTPLPGDRVKLSESVVSTPVAFVGVTGFTSTYDDYELVVMGFQPAVDDNITMRVSADNGATWDANANYVYGYAFTSVSAPSSAFTGSGAAGVGQAILSGQVSAGATILADLRMQFARPTVSGRRRYFKFWTASVHPTMGDFCCYGHAAYFNNAPSINALQIRTFNGNNIVGGRFILYGIAK